MVTRTFRTEVRFKSPRDEVFEYLADPANRPQWQASLLSVRLPQRRATPRVGLRWRETTLVGVRPRMEIEELEPGRLWTERGTWYGVTGILALTFTDDPARSDRDRPGCLVEADGQLIGSGLWSGFVRTAGVVAAVAVRSDLRRAARVLADPFRQ